MIPDLFNVLFEWVQQNPNWAYLFVFLIAAGESLAIVGLFVPGAVLMFGFGALVAVDALQLGPTLFWAAAGAVLGDGISFWIGRHFHQRLRVIWPFTRYPALVNRGVDFFHRHGGKSVLLARFLGPVRPILPAVAGMLDMPPRRFFTANVASALLWAPAYILPGVVFGAALALAAEVAGRLAVLLVVLVIVLWFGLWLVRATYRFLQPRAGLLSARVLDWSRRHTRLQPLTAALLDPGHPEARGLALLLLLLAVTSLLITWLLRGWLGGLDLFLHEAFQGLRTPVADRVLVLITGLGDSALLFTVLGAGCLLLFVRARHHAAVHWLAAALSALLLTRLLKVGIAAPRPPHLFGGVDADSFPSGHVSLSVAVYGFLAVLIARELAPSKRWMPYVCAALLLIPIAFSRLYLGAHWLSDVLAGAGAGLACVLLFGIAYRRHPARALGWPALLLSACTALVVVGGWRVEHNFTRELARYAQPRETRALDAADWWTHDWRRLPAQRHDLRVRVRQPLNLQYAGDLAALGEGLGAQGWRTPATLSATAGLLWLSPVPEVGTLPILPQVHNGKHDALRLLRDGEDGRTLYILRLWPTRWRLQPGAAPIWVGSVTELELRQPMWLFSYLVTGGANTAPLAALHRDLATACNAEARRRDGAAGNVLLVREC
jgi:membrane protein DedA with SNARE-associated domain/membrane-associated phospholipid phosphatase